MVFKKKKFDVFVMVPLQRQTGDSSFDLFTKTGNMDKDFEFNEMEMSIKTECVEIKSEEGEEESDVLLWYSNNETFENGNYKYAEENIKHVSTVNSSVNECDRNDQENNFPLKGFTWSKALYKYDTNIFEIKSESRDGQKNISQVYKCEMCEYKTKSKKLLEKYQIWHKDAFQVPMYRCDKCEYETKYRTGLIQHEEKHKSPSQARLYQCDICDFETKYRSSIKRHLSKHKGCVNI
ncbi:RE1-silencing transcription factor A-like [Anoplophora glabripennis]|uniref:RE1-silencing transcription factor A-like n=1 Tax=Anoplophora glabripennis TaxID=217634 RepID=UPI000873AE98|nr:RE1-silencing transcription factor A-like [Anoplophora glabripennis]XP_018574792.1 RE1-silencing transcription factor A-like [Anoplophora glabripennis]